MGNWSNKEICIFSAEIQTWSQIKCKICSLEVYSNKRDIFTFSWFNFNNVFKTWVCLPHDLIQSHSLLPGSGLIIHTAHSPLCDKTHRAVSFCRVGRDQPQFLYAFLHFSMPTHIFLHQQVKHVDKAIRPSADAQQHTHYCRWWTRASKSQLNWPSTRH